MRRIQGVLIDIDGTLIDSNDTRAAAWAEALQEANHPTTASDVRPFVGLSPSEILARLLGIDDSSARGREIVARVRTIFARRYLPRLVPHYRATEVLVGLLGLGLHACVVAPDPERIVRPMLARLDAERLCDRAVFPKEDASTPTLREMYKIALDRLNIAPSHVLLLADAPHDVEACARLGVSTVALGSGGFSRADLKGALAYYNHPEHLLAELRRSPFAIEL